MAVCLVLRLVPGGGGGAYYRPYADSLPLSSQFQGVGGGGLVLVLAGTRPVVSCARLSVHARPKAWECGVYRQCLSRSSPRIVSVSARAVCRVPGPRALRSAYPGVLVGSWTHSPIMGEEPYYGGPLAELHHLQCRQHVHMVC